MLAAPLTIARRRRLRDYLGFYWNTLTPLQHNLVAATVCVAVTRSSTRHHVDRPPRVSCSSSCSRRSLGDRRGPDAFSWRSLRLSTAARRLDANLVRAVGGGPARDVQLRGYNNVCSIGDEIVDRSDIRAIVLSIAWS